MRNLIIVIEFSFIIFIEVVDVVLWNHLAPPVVIYHADQL